MGSKDGTKAVSCIQGSFEIVPQLLSDHEEADTRLLLHAKHVSQTYPRIVMQSPDTDVAVLCIAHFEELQCLELWFQTVVKDRLRFIPRSPVTLFSWPVPLQSSSSIPCANWL